MCANKHSFEQVFAHIPDITSNLSFISQAMGGIQKGGDGEESGEKRRIFFSQRVCQHSVRCK